MTTISYLQAIRDAQLEEMRGTSGCSSLGLRGTLLLTAGVSVLGMALTFVLPEPARRSLEDMPASPPGAAPQPLRVADQASSP